MDSNGGDDSVVLHSDSMAAAAETIEKESKKFPFSASFSGPFWSFLVLVCGFNMQMSQSRFFDWLRATWAGANPTARDHDGRPPSQ